MLRDRHGLARRLDDARRRNEPLDARTTDRILASAAEAERRAKLRPAISYPEDLPIAAKRAEIADAIRENQVVVVSGETGSGKTTQLPKICLDLGRGVAGRIGHTQPRRLAARSVADRISHELGVPLGGVVGYKVRFTDEAGADTLVKLMTDGILLAETQGDRYLNAYDTIIIDEAHERSLNIDFLLGFLKNLLPRRPELKLVITSATIDVERFSKHFDDAPVIEVSGRTYPVEVRYQPLVDPDDPTADKDEEPDLPAAIVETVRALGREAPTRSDADTLVFLTGEREIREVADALTKANLGDTEILPLYARLSGEEQQRVFKPGGRRRIVLATNVAETSLTVPGIRYVVDPGLARISRYSPRGKVQRLPIEPISQASANQRSGRCGRVAEGVAVRLYSEENYQNRPRFTDPEVLRTNLASVILQMKALNLGRPEDFPFLDPPDYRQLRDGYQTLHELEALDEHKRLTPLGRKLARLPVDPKLGRMLLAAGDWGCVNEVLVITAALSIQDPRERPLDKRQQADEKHAIFRDPGGDFMGLLKLWDAHRAVQRDRSNNQARKWAREHFLNPLRMREWQDIHRQLRELSHELGLRGKREPAKPDEVHRALLAGLLTNVGHRDANNTAKNEYAGTHGKRFWLFPGSALFEKKPLWVMAAELVETQKLYGRTLAPIDPEWAEHAGGHLVHRGVSEPHWDARRRQAVAFEKVTLQGLTLVPRRRVALAPRDPKTARQLFLQHALVDGDYETDAPFFRENAKLVRELELLGAKTRRRDMLAGPEVRYDFYDARVPAKVVDAQSFDRWRKEAEAEDKRLLFMQKSDLLLRDAADLPAAQFPQELDAGDGLALPLSYRFDPGHAADGVTATVRLADLHRVDPRKLDWLVPGLLEEKCVDLIRTLPKPIRRQVVPAPQFAANAVHWMTFGEGDLLAELAASLGKQAGIQVKPADFSPAELNDYLRLRVVVKNDRGKRIAAARDVRQLQSDLVTEARDLLGDMPSSKWIRDDVTTWDFGDLPDRIEVKHHGRTVQGFPAVLDAGRVVQLRLLETQDAARRATREGVRRLFALDYERELQSLVEEEPGVGQMALLAAPLGGGRFKQELAAAVADQLARDDPREVRTRAQFEEVLESAWNRLGPTVAKVARSARETLERYHEVQRLLDVREADLMSDSYADMRDQLAHLVPPDFLRATPPAWLGHVPRYLRAMQVRHAKLHNAGLKRDLRAMAEVAPLWRRWKQLPEGVNAAGRREARWLIEELRVSLFAQELGTSTKVSPSRVEKALDALVTPTRR